MSAVYACVCPALQFLNHLADLHETWREQKPT
jgi:hypothetical protein